MPRIRTIKPEFFRSPSTAGASFAARILFEAMWCWADDYGIGETNINGLLGFAFCDDDGIDAAELQRLLTEVQCNYEVVFYIHRGRYYYAVPTWDEHQKNERRARKMQPLPTDPESAPDLRFKASEELHGTSVQSHGSSAPGTGEQGNRGTGEKTSTTAAPPKIAYTVEFQRWWSTYPRRDTGKADAAKAYDKARKIVDAETLLVAAQRYAQDPNLPDIQFIPHGAKWLNGKRWEDGPCPPRTDRRPTGGERAQRILEQGRALAAETQQMELR